VPDDQQTAQSIESGVAVWQLITFRQLVAAVVVAVFVGGLAALAMHASSPTYQSQAALLIDQPNAIAASGDAGVVAKLSNLRLKYVGIVSTSRIAGPVATRLGIPAPRAQADLSAAAAQNSLLLVVIARDENGVLAQRLARAAAEQLIRDVDAEQRRYRIPASQRYFFSIVTAASPAFKVEPTDKRVAAVSLVSGALAGAVVLGALVLRPRQPRAS
jgi:capsular polysaccharide biosynthesis protein